MDGLFDMEFKDYENRLTDLYPEYIGGSSMYRCSCGGLRVVQRKAIRDGVIKSCGCIARELKSEFCKKRKRTGQKQIDHFWKRVKDKNEAGCMEWMGLKNKKGYGICWWDGSHGVAHRISFMLAGGVIPDGQIVLHKCDNPPCVNPEHLRAGTIQDNSDDMMAKGRGRWVRGEEVSIAKLNPEKVRLIRTSTKNSEQLARELGVSPCSVLGVRNNKTWKHIP